MPPQDPYSFAYAGELAAHTAGDPSEMSRAEVVGRMLDQARRTKETSEEPAADLSRESVEDLRRRIARNEGLSGLIEASLREETARLRESAPENLPFGGFTGAERIESVAEATNWSRGVVDRIHGTRERIESWGSGPVELVEVSGENSDEVPGELVFSAPDGGHYSVEWESDVVTYLTPGEYGRPTRGGSMFYQEDGYDPYAEEGVSREEETLMGGLPVDKR